MLVGMDIINATKKRCYTYKHMCASDSRKYSYYITEKKEQRTTFYLLKKNNMKLLLLLSCGIVTCFTVAFVITTIWNAFSVMYGIIGADFSSILVTCSVLFLILYFNY